MDKKWILIAVPILVIVISVALLLTRGEKKAVPYFTPEPDTWIGPDRNSDNLAVDVQKATRTLSFFDNRKQEYYYFGKRVVFFSHGFYKGNEFTGMYFDPAAYDKLEGLNEEEQEDVFESHAHIRISPSMDPNDGVMDGFIMAKVENSSFVFFIFVDEDWRKQAEFTNILWGDDLRDFRTLGIREFDFSNSKNGIYYDSVSGANWFMQGTNGGVFVGEINYGSLQIASQKDLNATFIYIQ